MEADPWRHPTSGPSHALQRATLTGPLMETTLNLLFLTASRMAFSVVRLSAVTTLARPFLTSTVEPTTPGNAFNRLLSLRPQPGHSHPLMRNIHLNCRCAVDFANAPREPRAAAAAKVLIIHCRRFIALMLRMQRLR